MWIDFDYAYEFEDNPFGIDLFGLGSLLIFLAGKQIFTAANLDQTLADNSVVFEPSDFSLLYKNRIVNLKKIFPYVPDELNFIFLHFSQGAEIFYESVDEFLVDLEPCIELLKRRKP